MKRHSPGIHVTCVVVLLLASIVFFGAVLYTSLMVSFEAEPFGKSPLNTPRAAGVFIGTVSVLAQVLSMIAVARSASPRVLRILIITIGTGICLYHGLTLNSMIERWQMWGSAPKFWSGDTSFFWPSLVVSALAPPVFYALARFTRCTAPPH